MLLALLVAVSLPPAEVNHFAARVAQAVAQRLAPGEAGVAPATGVVVRVEDPGNVGAGEQLSRALRDALRSQKLEVTVEGEPAWQVHAYLSTRRGRPLAAARIRYEGREVAVLFAEFAAGVPPPVAPAEALAIAIRTRPLLAPDLPVLDLEADAAGNLFLLHPDRVRVLDLNAVGMPLKAELGLETGAGRLRDPLLRLVARDAPRQLEVYSAAASVPQPPPLPIEGYALRTFPAPARMRLPHPWRAVIAQVQSVAGRNYLQAPGVPELYGLAPVASPLRAHWVLLDAAGRLQLADADLRPFGPAVTGGFGGDVASAMLPCTGTLVLAASAEPNPARDRIAVLRVENDRLLPYTTLELDGAVRRLKALPATGDQRRVLAVAEINGSSRVDEIELRCAP